MIGEATPPAARGSRIRGALRYLALALLWIAGTGWASAAFWLDGPTPRIVAVAMAIAFALGSGTLLFAVHPLWRGMGLWCAALAAMILWQLGIPASNDRRWLPDVRNLPRATLRGDQVSIRNVRNFDYRSETEFSERWEDRSYDLRKLRGVDLLFSYWGSPWIAHTIASWDFGADGHLAISIETRKEAGESYSTVRGFFRQYELYYVVADERDVIRLRTNFRREEVYLYRVNVPLERARAILLSYLSEIEHLAEHPEWYNALTDNCTTSIQQRVASVGPTPPLDWRLLLNGHLPELMYERGTIDTRLPFDEVRRRSNVTVRARAAGDDPAFSERIRDDPAAVDSRVSSGS